MAVFGAFYGVVRSIEEFWTTAQGPDGCTKLISVTGQNRSIVNFVVSLDTYFMDREAVETRDIVVGFYDLNAPALAIYPPQYQAVVMAKVTGNQAVTVDHFNPQLINSDGTLQLRITRATRVLIPNGQRFTGSLQNRDLAVVYPPLPRIPRAGSAGVPEQITPTQVIVLCRGDLR